MKRWDYSPLKKLIMEKYGCSWDECKIVGSTTPDVKVRQDLTDFWTDVIFRVFSWPLTGEYLVVRDTELLAYARDNHFMEVSHAGLPTGYPPGTFRHPTWIVAVEDFKSGKYPGMCDWGYCYIPPLEAEKVEAILARGLKPAPDWGHGGPK